MHCGVYLITTSLHEILFSFAHLSESKVDIDWDFNSQSLTKCSLTCMYNVNITRLTDKFNHRALTLISGRLIDKFHHRALTLISGKTPNSGWSMVDTITLVNLIKFFGIHDVTILPLLALSSWSMESKKITTVCFLMTNSRKHWRNFVTRVCKSCRKKLEQLCIASLDIWWFMSSRCEVSFILQHVRPNQRIRKNHVNSNWKSTKLPYNFIYLGFKDDFFEKLLLLCSPLFSN